MLDYKMQLNQYKENKNDSINNNNNGDNSKNKNDDSNTIIIIIIVVIINSLFQPGDFFAESTTALYSTLSFLLLLTVFKKFSNNRDLILGTFFSLWPNGFFRETKLAIKNRRDLCVFLYTSSFISLEISFAFKLSYSYFVETLK